MKEKIKEIERQWREGMPIIDSDWELVFSYIFQLENKMEEFEKGAENMGKALSDAMDCEEKLEACIEKRKRLIQSW